MEPKGRKTRWARGFFRAWIILSSAWAALITAFVWADFPNEGQSRFMVQGETQWFTISDVYAKAEKWVEAGDTESADKLRLIGDEKRSDLEAATSRSLKNWIQVSALPPFVLLLIGLGVAWVLRGFRSETPGGA